MTPTIGPARPIAESHPQLEFIEVRAGAVVAANATLVTVETDTAIATDEDDASPRPRPTDEPGWSLWSDLER